MVGIGITIWGFVKFSKLDDYMEERLDYTLKHSKDNTDFMDSWNAMQTKVIGLGKCKFILNSESKL